MQQPVGWAEGQRGAVDQDKQAKKKPEPYNLIPRKGKEDQGEFRLIVALLSNQRNLTAERLQPRSG